MVIVQIIGGAASQMSAFSRGYVVAQKLNKELILDVSDYMNGYKFPYALDCFDLQFRKLKYTHTSLSVLTEKVIPIEFMKKYNPYVIHTEGKNIEQIYEETLQHKEQNIYMVGEGTSAANYINNIEEVFKIGEDNEFISYFKNRIKNIISVAVHIRRTDFVALGWQTEYAYYETAIGYMQDRFPNSVFFFFSDDIEHVQQHFGMKEQYRYVRLLGGFATDVVELFCMALCNHRIMTKKSGYSQWAKNLNKNKNAVNVVFSEEKVDNCVSLNRKDIEKFINDKQKNRSVYRFFEWESDKSYIEENIQKNNLKEAMHRLCEVSFDSGLLKKEELNKLYSYYENILFMKQNYIEAEQALLGHMELGLNYEDMYYNMAIVKRMLGKTMASYLFASRICRESKNKEFIQEFIEIFYMDENYDLFKKLVTARKIHFILCPQLSVTFYKKHMISMAIVLKQLGHEISIINPRKIEIQNNVGEDIVTDWCLKNGVEIDSSYHHHIQVYPCAKYSGGYVHNSIIEKLAKHKNVPTVIIGRNMDYLTCADKYPFIFLDYSEGKDEETQFIKMVYSNYQDYENKMKEKASVVITTSSEKCIEEKVKLLTSYISKETYRFDNEKFFTANYIDDENFLRFVFELLNVAEELIC